MFFYTYDLTPNIILHAVLKYVFIIHEVQFN
jgi:hypothetical protein